MLMTTSPIRNIQKNLSPENIAIIEAMQAIAVRPGKFVIASYGQDPQTGQNLLPKVLHFNVNEPAENIYSAIAELNKEPHRNVYMPLGTYRQDLPEGKKGGETDLVDVLGFMADLDDGDAYNWPGRVPVDPTCVLETSEDRYQALFLLGEPMTLDAAKPVAAMLQEYSGCDFGTKDLSHVWRIPGTLNWPNKKKVDGGRSPDPQLVKIVKPLNGYIEFEGLKATLDHWHSQRIKSQENSQQSSPTIVNDTELYQWNGLIEDLPVKAETKSLIISGAPVGQRSEAMQKVMGGLVYAGLNDGQIYSIFNLYPIGEKYRGQTNPAKWLQPQINKARSFVTDRATQRVTREKGSTVTLKGKLLPGLWEKPVNIADMINNKPEPVKWFIKNYFIKGRGAIVTGVGGSSKTRLLYHLTMGAILGRLPWNWEVETTGNVVLILTEDTADDVHRIIYRFAESFGLTSDDRRKVAESLTIYPLAGRDTILLSKTSAGTLEKSQLFLDLIEKIKAIGNVAFVGMDPALSLTDGDELDQSNQRALGKMADDLAVLTGATVALVTHATKGSLQQDVIGSHSSRGGGAITDAARTEFVMRTMTAKEYNKAGLTEPEEQFRHVQLVGTKGNYLPPSAYLPVWLRRDDYGMLSGANIELNKKAGPTKRVSQALDLLKGQSGKSDKSMDSWREACVEAGIIQSQTDDAARTAMKRIVRSLKDCGLIRKGAGKGIWLPAIDDDDEDF